MSEQLLSDVPETEPRGAFLYNLGGALQARWASHRMMLLDSIAAVTEADLRAKHQMKLEADARGVGGDELRRYTEELAVAELRCMLATRVRDAARVVSKHNVGADKGNSNEAAAEYMELWRDVARVAL